jgi:NAD(P)-dependent dehydrogenase (short-subunit alcohol dehydrogenase family)
MHKRVALITGAGSGIGLAMARRFADEDVFVVVTDVLADRVERAVSEIQTAGGAAFGECVDVSSPEQMSEIVQTTFERYGRLDILCNNAGIFEGLIDVANMDPERWSRVLEVNLTGPFLGCRYAIPVMLSQGGGVIINTGSIAGLHGGRSGVAYTASKFGLVGLTQHVAFVYGASGIRCNAVCPGPIATDIGSDLIVTERMAKMTEALAPLRASSISAEEVAQAASWLASDNASHINGVALVINAGQLAFV